MTESRTVAGEPGPALGEESSAGSHRWPRPQLWIAAAVLLFIVLALANYVEKWLWMRQVDYVGIFWTLLSVQWAMFGSAFVFAFLYLWLNLRQAAKNSARFRGRRSRRGSLTFLSRSDAATQIGIEFSPKLLKLAVILISAGVALFVATGFLTEWDTYLRFRYGGSFGVSDPLFGVDVGFYVFHLPFYVLLQSSLTLLTILTLAIVSPIYVSLGLQPASGSGRIARSAATRRHIFPCFSLFWSPISDGVFTSITTNWSIPLSASFMALAMRPIM